MNVNSYLGQEASTTVSYNKKDLILYSLGIGCTELPFVYENAPGFSAFPTYGIVLSFKGTSNDVLPFPSPAMMQTMNTPPLPGVKVGLDGERYLEVLHPLPLEGTFKLTSKLIGVHKRGKGALVENEVTISDDTKTYVRMVSGAFLVGAKDFEPEAAGETYSENVKVPSREPDAVDEVATGVHQTHLYRLSGDYNPLHIDPRFAKISGFQEPILHGLCSLGIATRVVLKRFGGNDPSQFKSIKLRFAKPVLPGQTLVVRQWKEGQKVIFEVLVKETNTVVVNNAYVELKAKSNL
jgi:3-hydroxyacyl-CoA dehydrogenase/3a,7a,12a-trihydroxy-5b-cholest-24-enoyl-CoA hydratase